MMKYFIIFIFLYLIYKTYFYAKNNLFVKKAKNAFNYRPPDTWWKIFSGNPRRELGMQSAESGSDGSKICTVTRRLIFIQI